MDSQQDRTSANVLRGMLLSFCLLSATVHAQFTTVMNLPPDPNISEGEEVGSNTQINLGIGGEIGDSFDAGSRFGTSTNVEINVFGGYIGLGLDANNGSTVNVSGGHIDHGFDAYGGSTVNLTGGSIGQAFRTYGDATVNISGGSVADQFSASSNIYLNIYGGEFRLDGVLLEGLETEGSTLPLNLPSFSLLSGTYADGTPFAISSADGDWIADGTLKLHASPLPAIGPSTIVIPGDTAPTSIRNGQTLYLSNEGILGNQFNAGLGSHLIMTGGQIGNHFEAVDAQITISGGEIGHSFDAFDNSTVEISGGTIQSMAAYAGSIVNISNGVLGKQFRARINSTVNISGGEVGDEFNSYEGSTVSISGGLVGDDFHAGYGSHVNITGGSVGRDFLARNGSTVNIFGGAVGTYFTAQSGSVVNYAGGSKGDLFRIESGSALKVSGTDFRIDGELVEGLETSGDTLPFNMAWGSVLSGTSTDGTPFLFSTLASDFIYDTITLEKTAIPAEMPTIIVVSSDPVPSGVSSGQTMIVDDDDDDDGIVGDNFNAGWNSTVLVDGGEIGSNFEAVGASVTLVDGSVGSHMHAFQGSTVNVTGGSVGYSFRAESGSVVNITAGTIGTGFDARDGSTVSISGGMFGYGFNAQTGSTVNISGGKLGRSLRLSTESSVTISGGEFRIEGIPISGLETVGSKIPINLQSGSVLSGTLKDGTTFAFSDLYQDELHEGATLLLEAASLPAVSTVLVQPDIEF